MGRRNWRRKQLTVHEVEEVTITRKKRKTYVLEDTPIQDEDDRKNKIKKPKPPLITDFDYGTNKVKDLSFDDDSDADKMGNIFEPDEREGRHAEKEVCVFGSRRYIAIERVTHNFPPLNKIEFILTF
jgi:hypothetical protein